MRIPKPSGALWSHRDFLRLWAAQTVSGFGARITRTALPITAVMAVHASPIALGILAAASQAPAFVVGLTAGGFVDRSSRRRILIASDILRALVLVTVPVAALLHVLTMLQLYIIAAVIAGLSVLFEIADHAYIPSLIDRADIVEGNTKLNLTDSVAEIGGPALGGFLVQLLTAPIAIAANAVTYLASALFLADIATVETPNTGDETSISWRRDLAAGTAAIFGNPNVWPLFLMSSILMLAGSVFGALYTPYALRTLGLSPTMLGITIGVGGIGAMLGAAITPFLSRRLGVGPAIMVASLGGVLFLLLVPLAHGSPTIATAFLMMAQLGGDALLVAMIILSTSVRQTLLPGDVLGRVAGVFQASYGLCGVAGALAGGALGSLIGMRETLWIAVAGYFLIPAIAACSPLRGLKSLPPDEATALIDPSGLAG